LFQKIVNFSNKDQNSLSHLLTTQIDSTRSEGTILFSALRKKTQSVASTIEALNKALSDSIPDGKSLETLSSIDLEQEQAITGLCRLHLIIFRDILDYQCAIWFPAPLPHSRVNPVPPRFQSIDRDLITLNRRCLARALRYRSVLLEYGATLQDEIEWALLTVSLIPSSLQPSSGNFDNLKPRIDLSLFLILKEKAILNIEKLCQSSRPYRGRPGAPGRLTASSGWQALDEGLVLGQTEYVLFVLSSVTDLPRDVLIPQIKPVDKRKDLVDRGRLGIWMGLQAGLDKIRITQALGRYETEVGPEAASNKGELTLEQEPKLHISASDGEDEPTSIQKAFNRVLSSIGEIPDDQLSEMLTQSRPWLPRLHVDAIRQPSVADSSDSDDTTDLDSDVEGEIKPVVGSLISVKRPRPILQDLFSLYESYQEQRLAIYLRWPAQVRNKVVLTRYMEQGVVGNVWRMVISRVVVVLGL
jgi:hypothetical protein